MAPKLPIRTIKKFQFAHAANKLGIKGKNENRLALQKWKLWEKSKKKERIYLYSTGNQHSNLQGQIHFVYAKNGCNEFKGTSIDVLAFWWADDAVLGLGPRQA